MPYDELPIGPLARQQPPADLRPQEPDTGDLENPHAAHSTYDGILPPPLPQGDNNGNVRNRGGNMNALDLSSDHWDPCGGYKRNG